MKVLLVLGCRVEYDPRSYKYIPGALLRLRLEKAVDTFLQIESECIIIVSGGGSPRRTVAESSVMKEFLVQQGIPGYKIFEESNSRNTVENCLCSYQLLSQMKGQLTYQEVMSPNPYCNYYGTNQFGFVEQFTSLIVVSSNFHLPRVERIFTYFNRNRLNLHFVGSETPRELLSDYLAKEQSIDIDRLIASYR